MYLPIEGGSVEVIQNYECQLPPVGYGKNRLTGDLEHIGVIKSSVRASDQVWQRIALPLDWDKRRKAEIKQQERDPEFYDLELERIREQHWQYRLCGLWFYNNGIPTYITGHFYMYLNWCQLDIGFPHYRDTDRKFFHAWEYCVEDPRCAGMVDIERRRAGKSFKAGSIILDRTSLHKNHHGGIQSKTYPDGKQLFMKSVVTFFKKCPDFFRPIYDKSKGITPTSELRFFQTTRKGRNAEKVLEEDELESWIDYGSSELFHYDGSKLNTYIADEYGKCMEVNVWDRWQVVKYCLDQDGVWIGKSLFTTTIEEMENGGENGKKVWKNSDPNKRNDNNRTTSGMYRFFLPAYETMFFDKHGMPLIEQAKEFLLNERAGLQHDPRALSAAIRKNPFTIEEAFRIDGDHCLYDVIKLNMQLDTLSWKQNLITRGNFVWENGEAFTKVKFEKSHNGRWEVACLIENFDKANGVVCRNGRYFPNNNFAFTIGCDPFKYDSTKDNRRSDCAAFVYKKHDPLSQNKFYNDAFVCYYRYRAATTSMQYEDLLKMAWYYGCQILFERNIDNWRDFYREKACEGFLMKLPGEDDYGVYTDGQKKTHQLLADYTEAYINEHIEKVVFKELIEDWLQFDIGATTKFDTAMAAGFTLIAARDKSYQRKIEDTKDVSNYFKMHKASA
jgi:hypothetical protein